jgi:CheY-like chemotaxis protein
MAHLLLVDDDDDIVEIYAGFLRSEGHVVSTASTGEEGLRALRAAPLPDLIVLDVDMPVLGGPGMAHDMLRHDAGEENVPILLMSGREDLPEIAGRMGTRYFLRKPADTVKSWRYSVERCESATHQPRPEREPTPDARDQFSISHGAQGQSV